MTGSKSTATSAKAEISFPNTNPSSIPSGNWLEGTISLQGQDSSPNNQGRDYLVRAAHVLYPNGNHGVVADMWEDCEGLLGDNCGTQTATELFAFIVVISGLSAGQPIYVRIDVTSNPTTLYWYYSYDGSHWYHYYTFTPPSTTIPALYVGTVSVWPFGWPYYTAYYYQFGMWSQSTFNGVTFNVDFQNPSYFQSGTWKVVAQAKTMEGPFTFFDYVWVLANGWWTHSWVGSSGSGQATFYYCSSCNGEPDNTIIWG